MARTMAADDDAESRPGLPTALACLVLIGRQLGADITPETLLRDNALPPGPLGTDALVGCARRAGLQSKVLHLGFAELGEVEAFLPAIARFRDGSCMVLSSISRDGAIPSVLLLDPGADADTPLVLDRARFEQAWTGDLVLIRRKRAGAAANAFGWPLVRRLVARERTLVRDLALSTLALSFVAIVPILFVQLLLQRVFTYGITSTMIVLSLGLAAAMVVDTTLGALRRYIVAQLTARVDAKLSTNLLDRVVGLPLVAAQGLSRGAITHKVDQLAHLRGPATAEVIGALLDLGLLVFFIPLMAFLSPLLTGPVVLVALVAGWVVAARVLPPFRVATVTADAAEERQAAFQSEVVAGIKTVKALALDVAVRRHWRRLSDDLAERRLGLAGRSSAVQALATLVERILVTGSLAVGVYLSAIDGRIAAVGALVAFYLLVQRLAAPMLSLAWLAEHAESTRRTLDMLAGLVGHPDVAPRGPAGSTAPVRGHVAFADVSFRYTGAATPALRGVSFDCPAGTLLGVMGRSGSGKTTVARLLQRLYGEHRGAITLDGVDIRDIDPAHLRKVVGVVGQDGFIFAGTIRENITAARIGAGFEEMTAAARMAGADEFIDMLPRGYETLVQEGAPNLSSGQRQRLALARAFLTKPRVLVLDEALSALDGDIEMRVLGNLRQMAAERTIILVSHRLTALMAADAVLVMEDGRVHDFGQHRDLLERSELYSSQWHRERVPPESDPHTDRLLALS